jgi:aerobic-type carbon monoxide dehydrogenase small subunit (CoxS/CutS family)
MLRARHYPLHKPFMTSFTVNDRPVRYRMDPETPLLWALRDASNLTGTKYGCGTGDCGACTVDIDGEAVRSCRISIAECEGRFVTTIEALSTDRSHPVQTAWVAHEVPQCGYCQPGMMMAAAALLTQEAEPDGRGHRRGDHQYLPLRHLPANQGRDPPRGGDAFGGHTCRCYKCAG